MSNICPHFKLVLAVLAGILAGTFLHISLLIYVLVAAGYIGYTHKAEVLTFIGSLKAKL